jgi:hypothetical protein
LDVSEREMNEDIIIVVGSYYGDNDDVGSHNPLGVIPFIPAALS